MQRRKELKYNIPSGDRSRLICLLNELMQHDEHSKNLIETDSQYCRLYGYTVSSIYFDNSYNSHFLAKLNGEYNKDKYRLRVYNHNLDYILAEHKKSTGTTRYKESIQVPLNRADSLLVGTAGRSDWEYTGLVELSSILPGTKPVILIKYTRLPYMTADKSVRITLDFNIRAHRLVGENSLQDILNLETIPISPINNTILEVKYDSYIPENIKTMISKVNRTITDNSKYIRAMLTV